MYDQNQDPYAPRLFTTKQVAKYALLPGVFPRMKRLADCFSSFLYMFTQILGTAGLIDRHHPCLRYENKNDYPFSYILAMAWHNVKFDKKHLPQAGMFVAVILAILLMISMLVTFVGRLFLTVNKAQAQFFGQPSFTDPDGKPYTINNDWAFKFLDRIFGNGDKTGVDFWTKNQDAQNPWFTDIFSGMMQHYSLALLFIAAIMILYLLVITIAESARSGEPFGTKFDSVWAPIRLAMAIGLLVPISGTGGYNAAQLIVFQASEWGSNLATNVWYAGLNKAGQSTYVSAPNNDQKARFLHDILMINLCVYSLGYKGTGYTDGTGVEGVFAAGGIFPGQSVVTSNVNGVITFTYGAKNDTDYCGQVTLPMPLKRLVMKPATPTAGQRQYPDLNDPTAKQYRIAPMDMPKSALDEINQIIIDNMEVYFRFSPFIDMYGHAQDFLQGNVIPVMNAQWVLRPASDLNNNVEYMRPQVDNVIALHGDNKHAITEYITSDVIKDWVQKYETIMEYGGNPPRPYSNSTLVNFNKWLVDGLRRDAKYGWTTAGVFYLRLSNGFSILQTASDGPVVKSLPKNYTKFYAVPSLSLLPNEFVLAICSGWLSAKVGNYLMDDVCKKMEAATGLTAILRKASAAMVNVPISDPDLYAKLGGPQWADNLAQPDASSPTSVSTDSVFGFVSKALVNAVKINNNDINPLGQVIRWGHSLMHVASYAYLVAIVGGLLSPAIAQLGVTLGHAFLIPGFILAYFIPMQPFLYFMFAVVEWMISVLEAIIGAPLWALSFISLEGDFIGKSMKGVKMIFELVLRPTIIVISVVVSVLIFTASIQFINDSFSLFLGAYTGAEIGSMGPVAGAIGGFAMMLIYMFLIYSLATSCFKLIDAIPNNFGRWLDLPKGFGAEIKAGVDSLSGVIAGGAVLGTIDKAALAPSGVTGEYRANKQKKRANKAAEDQQDRLDSIDAKLSLLNSGNIGGGFSGNATNNPSSGGGGNNTPFGGGLSGGPGAPPTLPTLGSGSGGGTNNSLVGGSGGGGNPGRFTTPSTTSPGTTINYSTTQNNNTQNSTTQNNNTQNNTTQNNNTTINTTGGNNSSGGGGSGGPGAPPAPPVP